MTKLFEKTLLIAVDFFMILTAFLLWLMLRSAMGFFAQRSVFELLPIFLAVLLFWIGVFTFFGQYHIWFTRSRIDEFINVIKTVTVGIFLIFIITFDVEQDLNQPFQWSRLMIVSYWGLMIVCVGFGRVILRTIHRKLLERGIGLRKTIIVGWGRMAKDLYNRVIKAPALGYDVVGFVSPGEASQSAYKGIPVLGRLKGLHRKIRERGIQEILIALPLRSKHLLPEVIAQCDGTAVGMKIVPDLYDVLVGQVKTNQIYGFPLIEILPELMPAWERVVKRLGDMIFSTIVLVVFLPFWMLLALIIVIDSRGPVFYTQKRVGKDGKTFSMIKFRSMVLGAEKMTGPVWARDNDPRITKVGRVMRRLRLDEIPQLVNILKGDMSLVGPRPERPFFVEKLSRVIPLYTRRLRIRPGITGWAQVKGDYDQSLEDVKEKLEYDLFYLENMSLRMDLKIILNTLYVMVRGRGQ